MKVARESERSVVASCAIAVMAKASLPGQTKTRLVPPLTFDEAAAFNTAFLRDVAANIAAAGQEASIACYMAYGPPGSHPFFESIFPTDVGLIESWHANFGDCLDTAIEQVLARGHEAAVVLNSDSPTLPTALLVETARALARPGDRAVLGPSSDGGYYLLGLKAAHRHMFDNIEWSTERVAEETRERAREIGLELHTLPLWYDVDDIDGLRRLYGELYGEAFAMPRLAPHSPHYANETAKLMAELSRDHDFGARIEKVLRVAGAGV
jgi:rSAM/selenodomain-associated transferase 1